MCDHLDRCRPPLVPPRRPERSSRFVYRLSKVRVDRTALWSSEYRAGSRIQLQIEQRINLGVSNHRFPSVTSSVTVLGSSVRFISFTFTNAHHYRDDIFHLMQFCAARTLFLVVYNIRNINISFHIRMNDPCHKPVPRGNCTLR